MSGGLFGAAARRGLRTREKQVCELALLIIVEIETCLFKDVPVILSGLSLSFSFLFPIAGLVLP